MTALLFTLAGCSFTSEPSAIDLDGVLDLFVETVDGIDAEFKSRLQSDPEAAAALAEAEAQPMEIAPTAADEGPDPRESFAEFFAGMLNSSPHRTHYEEPLGVTARADGAFVGFHDANLNGAKDADEKDVFSVEIDLEGKRLIATDLGREGYHREQGYRSRGPGLFTGMLLGSMLSRQQSSGVDTSRFRGMSFSPRGYHAGSGARRFSPGSARGVGGSRSISVGK